MNLINVDLYYMIVIIVFYFKKNIQKLERFMQLTPF